MYYVNDGVHGSFTSHLMNYFCGFPKPIAKNSGICYPSSVWGHTCSGSDCIVEECHLPEVCHLPYG